jgi:(p)ppGpp synthase/HD superfamily hydrolase
MPSTPGIDAAIERSGQVRAALETARAAHASQFRNGARSVPYIDHPLAVAECLAAHGFADEVLAAALLHDVVEDSEMEVEDVRARFGERVAELVAALTEDDSIDGYEERKEEQRRRAADAGSEALAIYAADKLANVELLREAYAVAGESVSERLKAPLDLKVRVWEADIDTLFDQAPELAVVNELADALDGLWGERVKGARAAAV